MAYQLVSSQNQKNTSDEIFTRLKSRDFKKTINVFTEEKCHGNTVRRQL